MATTFKYNFAYFRLSSEKSFNGSFDKIIKSILFESLFILEINLLSAVFIHTVWQQRWLLYITNRSKIAKRLDK